MAKLYFYYSTMNAGKSTNLLQAAYNYEERGMNVYLLTAANDNRDKIGYITSRIGLKRRANLYDQLTNLYQQIEKYGMYNDIACILIDEAQFLTPKQVWQLAIVVDDLKYPVMCYGLRVDFLGNSFPGSAALLALADEMREIKTICHCGQKATMVVRRDESGKPLSEGKQILIGGNDTYTSLCRRHWRKEMRCKEACNQ